MRALIVDDSPADRKMLRQMIAKAGDGWEVLEAGSVGEMYAGLARNCQILFQDIALGDGDDADSQGLDAIFDVLDSYPGLPIVIVTGYFEEKIREFHERFLGKTRQVVDFLDKGNWDARELKGVFEKAQEYREKQRLEQEEGDATMVLLEEMERSAEERLGALVREERSRLKESMELDRLYRAANSGEAWTERIRAEHRITRKHCNQNATRLGILIEKEVKRLYKGDGGTRPTFYEKIMWIKDARGIAGSDVGLILRAWGVRNRLVHGEGNATKDEALAMEESYRVLLGCR